MGSVFPLYCAMTHDRTLRDICTEHNMQALRVDERKLVLFGLLRGLIRRVHKVGPARQTLRRARGWEGVCACMGGWAMDNGHVLVVVARICTVHGMVAAGCALPEPLAQFLLRC